MKLSKLRSLCDRAIEKYGDMDIGVYPRDDAYEITDGSETFQGLHFRVVQSALQKSKNENPTAVLFYD